MFIANQKVFLDQLRQPKPLLGSIEELKFMLPDDLFVGTNELLIESALTGRIFDLGKQNPESFVETAYLGKELFEEGIASLPFQEPWLVTFQVKDNLYRYSVLVFYTHQPGEVCSISFRHEREGFLIAGVTVFSDKDMEPIRQTSEAETIAMRSLIYNLVSILNTKGVGWESVPTKARSNKVYRAGYHKPSATYFTALRSYQKGDSKATGTGKSPKPHYRRGHMRTLPSGEKTWVNACLVNVANEDEMPFMRRAYKL